MMQRDDLIFLGCLAGYVTGAFLTFGWAYNRMTDCGERPSDSAPNYVYSEWVECRGQGIGVFITAVAWPVYWAGKGAIEITK